MNKVVRILIRNLHVASAEKGISGFKERRSAKRAVKPYHPYPGGFCHTRDIEEMTKLARIVGADTPYDFKVK